MPNKQEIALTKKMIAVLKKRYGSRCKKWDYKDFPELAKRGTTGRCPTCHMWETIDSLEEHVKVMRYAN